MGCKFEKWRKKIVKKFISVNKFNTEKQVLNLLGEKLMTKEVQGEYYVLMDFIKMKEIKQINTDNLEDIVSTISNFYMLFSPKKVLLCDYIEEFESDIQPYLRPYISCIKKAAEGQEADLYFIHGDFGLRNIYEDIHGAVKLYDYERSKYALIYEDLTKLYYRELSSEFLREMYIEKFNQKNGICLDFDSFEWVVSLIKAVNGIDDYLKRYDDKELKNLKNLILEDLHKWYIRDLITI